MHNHSHTAVSLSAASAMSRSSDRAAAAGDMTAPAPASQRALIEDLSLALVREYLAKKKYRATLDTLQSELVRLNSSAQACTRATSTTVLHADCAALILLSLSPSRVIAARETRSNDHVCSRARSGHQPLCVAQRQERAPLCDAAGNLCGVHVQQIWKRSGCEHDHDCRQQ